MNFDWVWKLLHMWCYEHQKRFKKAGYGFDADAVHHNFWYCPDCYTQAKAEGWPI